MIDIRNPFVRRGLMLLLLVPYWTFFLVLVVLFSLKAVLREVAKTCSENVTDAIEAWCAVWLGRTEIERREAHRRAVRTMRGYR